MLYSRKIQYFIQKGSDIICPGIVRL